MESITEESATHSQPAFVDNALEGNCGCLGDLFGDGFRDKPSENVPNDDPIWFTECCEPADSEPFTAWQTKDQKSHRTALALQLVDLSSSPTRTLGNEG